MILFLGSIKGLPLPAFFLDTYLAAGCIGHCSVYFMSFQMPTEKVRICNKTIICVNAFQLFLSVPSGIVSNDSMVDLIDHFLFPRFRVFSIFQFLMNPVALTDQVLHRV